MKTYPEIIFKLLVYLPTILISMTVCAQQDSVAIFGWEEYFSYQKFTALSASETALYTTSDVGVVKWDLEEVQPTRFSKINGLSDVKPVDLHYFDELESLVIIYENSNIDIVTKDRVKNIPSILLNDNLVGRKGINSITPDTRSENSEEHLLWIAGEFGVTSLNVSRGIFETSVFTDEGIDRIELLDDEYYAISQSDIYRFKGNDDPFISDFNQWDQLGTISDFPSVQDVEDVIVYDSHLFLNNGNDVYTRNLDNKYEKILEIPDSVSFHRLINDGHDLYVLSEDADAFNYNILYKLTDTNDSISIDTITYGCTYGVTDMVRVKSNLYIGNSFENLTIVTDGNCYIREVNSPHFQFIQDVEVSDDRLYITAGGITDNYFPQYEADGYAIYQDDEWTERSVRTIPELGERGFVSVIETAPLEGSDEHYICSGYRGIMKVNPGENEYQYYNYENSCLQFVSESFKETRIVDIALDDQNNLWASNYLSENGLAVIRANGECESIDLPVPSQLGDIVIDNEGNVWAGIVASSVGFVVYNPETEDVQVISTSNSNLPDNNVRSLAVDKDGSVWVGTQSGVIVYGCGSNIFENICGSIPVIDEDNEGIGDQLLNNQNVRSIAVDEANRKWFGTDNGILVQSSSSRNTVYSFNTNNSPLPSDVINDISIDDATGKVYVATDIGLVSFKSDATEAISVHAAQIISYPNPVRPDYDGPVVIKGLADNSRVKITDQRGYLVTELFSRGGQAVWDVTNSDGNRVASGVYLIYSSGQSSLGKPDAKVGKILVVK